MFKFFKKKEHIDDIPLPPPSLKALSPAPADISSIRAPGLFQPFAPDHAHADMPLSPITGPPSQVVALPSTTTQISTPSVTGPVTGPPSETKPAENKPGGTEEKDFLQEAKPQETKGAETKPQQTPEVKAKEDDPKDDDVSIFKTQNEKIAPAAMPRPGGDGWIELIPKDMLKDAKPEIKGTKPESAPEKPAAQQEKQSAAGPAEAADDEDLTLPDFDDFEDLNLDDIEAPASLAVLPATPQKQWQKPIFVRAFDYIRIMNEKKRIQSEITQSFRQADEFSRMHDQEQAVHEAWYDSLNLCQEKLIEIDQRLFDKVKA